jgi:hypothetical protein
VVKTIERPVVGTSPLRTRSYLDNRFLAWTLLLLGLLVLTRLAFRGWIPHDEGTLGQAASRVLDGEVPHVDFHDTYGGLQAYAHSVVFSLIGESIRSLRIANLGIAAIASFASFSIVRRVQPMVVAASVGVAVMLIGFAAYPASMPSWWNASLGLASTALVLHWLNSRNGMFLVASGLVSGLSFLVKSTGAYVAAGIALFLLILVNAESRRRWNTALGAMIVACFAGLLTADPSLQPIFVLLLPLVANVFIGFRIAPELGSFSERAVTPRDVVVFSGSCLAPVVVYAFPYFLSGNGDALVSGWFRLPQLRFESASWGMELPVLPLVLLASMALLIYMVRHRLGSRWAYRVSVVLIVGGAFSGWSLWWLLLVLLVVLVPLVVAMAISKAGRGWRLTADQLLLAIVVSAFAFIQFPVSNLIYGVYLVPLVLTGAGVWIKGPSRSRAFALVLLLTASIVAIHVGRGQLYAASPLAEPVSMVPLETERGGIDIPVAHAFYVELVDHLEGIGNSPIYAGPDAPEVYFLTGAINPTPVLFDFLAESWRIEEIEASVLQHQLPAVVVNGSPDFSPPLPEHLVDTISNEFSDHSSFGWFDVYENQGSHER